MPGAERALVHRQLHHRVAERLRSAIMEGRIRPGEWLRQEKLAAEHGVSQMPVREAIKQLAAEGLVEHVPYRGARVVEFTREDVVDLYACRSFIEGMAARHAAERISDEEVAELHRLYDAMESCAVPDQLGEYRELNRRFHGAIFSASRHSFLVRTLAQLWAAFPSMLWSNIPQVAVTSVPDRNAPDAAEHAEIVAALEARNPDRAERAVRAHIEAAGRTLLAAMERPRCA
ncbi:MAG: GntR family transcriptional regulator [Acidobacteriota bacterium]